MLYGNELSGPIPATLGNLSNVGRFWLAGNQLTGSIPDSFSHLAGLWEFQVQGNQLSGKIPEFLVNVTWRWWSEYPPLDLRENCFDISPSSENRAIIRRLAETGVWTQGAGESGYSPQNLGCGPTALGDLNNDGCVDRIDLSVITTKIRERSNALTNDLNHDGKVDIADARFLVLHFTHPDGSACPP
jgi:hypothetical protein